MYYFVVCKGFRTIAVCMRIFMLFSTICKVVVSRVVSLFVVFVL